MKYTTLQEDGTFRTIDTDNDSLFSLVTEFVLDKPLGRKKRREKQFKLKTKSKRVKPEFRPIVMVLYFIFFFPLALVYWWWTHHD